MAAIPDPNATATSSEYLVADTYSLTDAQLADSIEFIEEIGFGNWGSVWSCRSRLGSSRRKLAVKLVHRTSERTTAARVRSIWNEMKIVRTLKDDRHPAIIDFHSFIITPSYALVTMEYLPRLVPVEVREPKAKIWFESLLGGVAHLHARGIVHNDIKPANILLSRAEQPVLVDFGFAERYELLEDAESFVEVVSPSKTASTSMSSSRRSPTPAGHTTSTKPVPFESSLAYGTPEYLSPERARGYKHDTRKSDVWSLGVTFFEIITGRTPFELDDNEEFTTKEDLERYWARTNSGSWVGTWKMSSGLESLLVKMLRPSASERISAGDALANPYFATPTISAEIRVTTNGKAMQPITIGADLMSPPVFTATTDSRPASPAMGTARSKLSVLQNLMAKQPQLPGSTAKISRKPSAPIQRDSKRDSLSGIMVPRAPTPNDKPLPTVLDEKPKSRSFFSSHKRTKSAATVTTSAGISTPLTPKAIAHAAPPRAPPTTPCTPAPSSSLPSRRGLGRGVEAPPVPVPVAAAAALEREAQERAGVYFTDNGVARPVSPPSQARPAPAAPAAVASKVAAVAPAPVRSAPSTIASRIRAPAAPSTSNSNPNKVLSPIRSALRPVPGKENVSSVKVKVRAFESRNSATITNSSNLATAKPKLGENVNGTPTKGGLKVKDKNRPAPAQDVLNEKNNGVKGRKAEVATAEKVITPKRSLLKKKPSAPLKKENSPEQLQLAPAEKQASRGRRALHAISRSIDLGRPKAGAESSMSHLRHSVRKSIDKTAERFGHKSSTTADSLSRRPSKHQKSAADLQDLQDSWDDLEKDRVFRSVAQLPPVIDNSGDDMTVTLPQSPAVVEQLAVAEDESLATSTTSSSRMALWVQNVERAASETVEQLERRASTSMSRRSSTSNMLFGLPPTKRSTEPLVTSLPPPKRRGSVTRSRGGSVSSRRPHSRNASASMLDLLSDTPPTRLSAILDDESRKLLLEGGVRRKPMSIGSINSSTPPTEMPTIPTIAVEDLGPIGIARESSFYARAQSPSHQGSESYQLEPSRSYRSPDTTLDLSRLAQEVGVNSHRWATPRSSTMPTSRSSTPAHRTPTSIQIVTPPTPQKRPAPAEAEVNDDSLLIASENVVRVGKGYESSKSFRGRGATSSASFYQARQSTENIAPRDSSDKQRSPDALTFAPNPNAPTQSESMRTKKAANRRSSIFATLRGRQHGEMTGISSTTYFASANEFSIEPVTAPSPSPSPAYDPYSMYDPAEHGVSTGQQRANTLTNRMKKAFLRVVSNPATNRPATIGVAS